MTCCLVAASAVLGQEFAAGTGPVGIAGDVEIQKKVHTAASYGGAGYSVLYINGPDGFTGHRAVLR